MSHNNFFEEVHLNVLLDEVGKDFLENSVCVISSKILEVLGIDSLPIKIIKNLFDSTFSFYDQKTEELLFSIERHQKKWFIKPFFLVKLLSIRRLEEYSEELFSDISKNRITILDDLFRLNELPLAEKINDYLYYLVIILVSEYNLDLEKSSILKFDDESIIIDGNKVELVENKKTKEIEFQEVIYMINIKSNTSFFSVVKIFEDNKKETYIFNIEEYFTQENSKF